MKSPVRNDVYRSRQGIKMKMRQEVTKKDKEAWYELGQKQVE